VTLSKNGAAFASPAGAVSEIGSGWYQVAGNATDTGTLGPLLLHATATGADATDVFYEVVAFDPTDAAGLGLSRLDAAISTRSTYAGGAVASVTADVGITQAAADKVWGSAARTLTGWGTLVTDVAAAVWGAASRTLSAFGFNVTVGTNLDKTGYSLATAPPTAAVITATVLDELLSSHTGVGSVGAGIAAAGAAGDPWATVLPSTYSSGQAGYLIGHNLDVPVSTRAGAGASVTTTGPVLAGGSIALVAGDTYQTERGTALQWTYTGPVDLLTAPAPAVTFTISTQPDALSVPVTVGGTPGAITLTAELTAAESATLPAGGAYPYSVFATWADPDTDRVTLIRGPVRVAAGAP
jgi:hypothetical protein